MKNCLEMKFLWLFVIIGGLFLPLWAHGNEMVLIPAGPFAMGAGDGEADEQPPHEVYVDAFYMDRYPVTNAEYAEFLNIFGNQKEGGKKWLDTDSLLSPLLCKIQEKNGQFVPKRRFENHPVVKVSWYGAMAYARWKGKRLPTEAEWEKAARGGLPGQMYVFGNKLASCQANIAGNFSSRPVGCYVSNGYGLYDMVAQVWQWCSDWYDPSYYQKSPAKNPQGPGNGMVKVLRGGSWFHKDNWRVAERAFDDPLSRNFCFVTGFRCAKDVESIRD
jgi:formylglycine-generating enzyme required for sulfatase activity